MFAIFTLFKLATLPFSPNIKKGVDKSSRSGIICIMKIERFTCSAASFLRFAKLEVEAAQQNMRWVEEESSLCGHNFVMEHRRFAAAQARIDIALDRLKREQRRFDNHNCATDRMCAILDLDENGSDLS